MDVQFSAAGKGAIVGDNPRISGAGIASVLLRAGTTPGAVMVTAAANGLTKATLVVHSVPPDPTLQAWQ